MNEQIQTEQPNGRRSTEEVNGSPHQKYDQLFRRIFADKELRWHLLRESLPEEIAVRMDDERAECERKADTYTRQSGGSIRFDGLFRLKLPVPGSEDEHEDLLVLVEAKSTTDWRTMGQILTYRGEIAMLDEFQIGRGKTRRYPVVLAVLLYCGHRGWPFKDSYVGILEYLQGVVPPPTGQMWDLLSTGVVRRNFAEFHPDDLSGHSVLRGALSMAVLAADDKLDGNAEASAEMMEQWRRNFDHALDCIEGWRDSHCYGNWLMRAIEDRRGLLREAEERRAAREGNLREGKRTMATLAEQFMRKGEAKGRRRR